MAYRGAPLAGASGQGDDDIFPLTPDERESLARQRLRDRYGYSAGYRDGYLAGYTVGARNYARETLGVLYEPERISALREAGHRLHAGGSVDVGWLAAQLWDFADVLEMGGRDV